MLENPHKLSFYPSVPVNRSARDFLLLCDGSKTYKEILELLSQEYGIETEEVFENINPFYEESVKKEHLEALDVLNSKEISITGSKSVYYPAHMQFELTDKCNMYCNYCYRNAESLKKSNELEEDDRSFHEVKKMLDNCYDNGVRAMEITGGEPMISKNFIETLKLMGGYGIIVAIETNGSFITDEIADMISEFGNIILSVSLDAPNEELNKRICHCEGAFEKTVSGLKKLADRKVKFRVTTVACQENIDYIEEILLLAKSIGASEYGFALPLSHGRQKDVEKKDRCSIKKLSDRFVPLYEELDNKYPGFLAKMEESLKEYHEGVGNCGAGHRSFTVDPNGTARACPMSLEDWAIVGNLYESSYESIFNSEKIQFFRGLKNPSSEWCSNCPDLGYCMNCIVRGISRFNERKETGNACNWAECFNVSKLFESEIG